MKEYVDEKFWRMFSGFITLLAFSVIVLIAIKVHTNKEVEAVPSAASVASQ